MEFYLKNIHIYIAHNIFSDELILHIELLIAKINNHISRHFFVRRINCDLIELSQIYNYAREERGSCRKAFSAKACRRFRGRVKATNVSKQTPYSISEIKSTCREDISILADYRGIVERQKKLEATEHMPSASNLTVAFGVFALV